jgi:hypothetical protein
MTYAQTTKGEASGDFSGTYIAKGFRPGEEYTAKPSYVIQCVIQKKGDYYMLRWYENNKLAYYGLGLHVNDVLSASYLSVDNSIYGTVSYSDFRSTKGYLAGAWCIAQTHPDALSNLSNGMEILYPEK